VESFHCVGFHDSLSTSVILSEISCRILSRTEE